jgi:hypothetical protein
MGCGLILRRRLQIRSRCHDNGRIEGIEEERSNAQEENWVEDGLDSDILKRLILIAMRSPIFQCRNKHIRVFPCVCVDLTRCHFAQCRRRCIKYLQS